MDEGLDSLSAAITDADVLGVVRAEGRGEKSLFPLPSALCLVRYTPPMCRFVLPLLLSTCLSACAPSSPSLQSSHASAESLARAVLTALERRDVEALRALAIDEQEFREAVWPELPAARPERNLPLSYVWGDLHQKSNAMLRATLAKHGGKRYELLSIRFTEKMSQYESYRVHRASELTVSDTAGAKQQIRVFGSVLEKDNRFKVFSYIFSD